MNLNKPLTPSKPVENLQEGMAERTSTEQRNIPSNDSKHLDANMKHEEKGQLESKNRLRGEKASRRRRRSRVQTDDRPKDRHLLPIFVRDAATRELRRPGVRGSLRIVEIGHRCGRCGCSQRPGRIGGQKPPAKASVGSWK